MTAKRAVIAGTGYSKIARTNTRSIGALTIDAIKLAVSEAGIDLADVDGLSVFPSLARIGGGEPRDGIDYVGAQYLAATLPVRGVTWAASLGPGSFLASVIEAANAVEQGLCKYAVAWRSMYNPPGKFGRYRKLVASGADQFTAPYGMSGAITANALPYARYCHQYGATREHMAAFIVSNRQFASVNPDAVFYGKPITKEEYLDSPLISAPFCRLDCDMPVTGCSAVVVTTAERADSAQFVPVRFLGRAASIAAYGHGEGFTLDVMQDTSSRLAQSLWARTGLGPDDIDTANLYDGFSFFTYVWLEALGFCARGEAYEFVQCGRIGQGGSLPLNTSGGSLGMGRMHGPPQVIESVRQIQGRCGSRQVAGAEVALAANGNPGKAPAIAILAADR